MFRHIRHFIQRHEPEGHAITHLKSGFGALLAMVSVGAIAVSTGLPLLAAIVVAGSVIMIAIAVLHHQIPPRQQYPLRLES